MHEAFYETKPIETLFEQIEDAVEYADAANAAYNTKQIISRANLLVYITSLYIDA